MQIETLSDVLRARADKRPAALLTDLQSGVQTLVTVAQLEGAERPDSVTPQVERAVLDAVRTDRSGTVDEAGRTIFVQVLNPPLKLYIVGAVHIAQALAPMALATGYRVTVIDPRRSFATEARFEAIELDTNWPDDALESRQIDARTAIVTLTHDPKLDDPALHCAVRSEAFYIGSLGSRKTHAARLERLRRAGFEATEMDRIHGPIGLDIGARSPAEIAIAILGEMTRALRQGSMAQGASA